MASLTVRERNGFKMTLIFNGMLKLRYFAYGIVNEKGTVNTVSSEVDNEISKDQKKSQQ